MVATSSCQSPPSSIPDSVSNGPALDLVGLTPLMGVSSGRADLVIGLLDGPVANGHRDLGQAHVVEIPGGYPGRCTRPSSPACRHGTFVAGILCARRGSAAPAICPDCTVLVRPIFREASGMAGWVPSATPEDVAVAIVECVDAGVRVLNVSATLVRSPITRVHTLDEALAYAASRGVITVAAAGNEGVVASSAITRHPWVIPVTGCDLDGSPLRESNLAGSIGRRGLMAPGRGLTSLGAEGMPTSFQGSSAATVLVTGTVALLWSIFPLASPAAVRAALAPGQRARRGAVVPPVLDAWAAYRVLSASHGGEGTP
jgi:subtilisin family serine protease